MGGSLLSKITGFGDYAVEGNSLMRGGMTPPEVVNAANHGGVIVRHREYINDLRCFTVDFAVNGLSINPGQVETFPWLSTIANAFEEYEFRGLLFEFRSLSSDAIFSTAASSALGYVAMATNYNAGSPLFINKKALENYEFANSSKPSNDFIHPVECKRSLNAETHLYNRTGAVPAGQDIRLYDLGTLNIAIGGMQNTAGAIIGELWCTYEIEFYKPRYLNAAGVETDHWSGAYAVGFPFGNGPLQRYAMTGSNLGLLVDDAGIRFPQEISSGRYLMTCTWKGTVATVTSAYPVITPTYCTLVGAQWLDKTSNSTASPAAGGVTLSMTLQVIVQINAVNASLAITAGTLPTGTMQFDLVMQETQYVS